MSDNYREPEDLLSDPNFLSWYFKTGEANARTWEEWTQGRPDRDLLVKKAIALLDTARLPEQEPSLQQLQRAEQRLLQRLDALDIAKPSTSATTPPALSTPIARSEKTPAVIGRRRWMIAASILVLLAAGFFITRYIPLHRPGMATGFGQISSQQLPDGSMVMMNANSRLSYSSGWEDGRVREVWIDGEAFFHVKKTAVNSQFIVHTEHFDIIVTGTQFNVSNRHGVDNVLLQEGSVTLRTRDGKSLMMKPGDFVNFDPKVFEKKMGCKDMLLAWKEQKLILDHTSISQLATIINDLYGASVTLEGDSIAAKKISGILPNNNLDILLKALEATSEYDVAKDAHGGIVISAHARKN